MLTHCNSTATAAFLISKRYSKKGGKKIYMTTCNLGLYKVHQFSTIGPNQIVWYDELHSLDE
jgi:hypothetical protein